MQPPSIKRRRPITGFSGTVESLEGRLLFAVFNVNSTADILSPPPGVVTLRSAIQTADATPGGNTINLTVPGTYKITLAGSGEDSNATGDFDILPASGGLSLINTSGGAVVVDANHFDRAFDINPNFNPGAPTPAFTVTMQGFTIENGSATNAVNPDGPSASGGGIRAQGNASLTLINMTVTANTATADGGGISMENTVSAPWSLTLNNTTVSNNRAGDSGGGIETDGAGNVTVEAESVITGNTAVNQGGGIWLDAIQVGTTFQSSNLTLNDAVVSDNASLTLLGGGIGTAGNGRIQIKSASITGNRAATTGGGLVDQNAGAAWNISQTLISQNFAGTSGGGIFTASPNLAVTSSLIQGNQAGSFGGGVFDSGQGLSISQSTFSGNVAAGGGGAMEIQTSGNSTIQESTITGNTAVNSITPATGAGIDAGSAFTGSLTLLNDTITSNLADQGGGVHWSGTSGSAVRFQNTVVATNRATQSGPDVSNVGSVSDGGGNLIGVSGAGGGNSGFQSTTPSGTLASPLDPGLGSLTNNNGPLVGDAASAITLPTQAPLPGSPLIAHGVVAGAPSLDERGLANMINGAVNIGAVSNGGATIGGNVFNDLNYNGVRSANEPGMANVTVYLDANNNGRLDPGELTTTTDAAGNFSFPNLFPGQYVVREIIPAGYALTTPVGDAEAIAAAGGTIASGAPFGNVLISSVQLNASYFLLLARNFGKPGTIATGDLNGDGTVNLADLLLLTRNFGHGLVSPAMTTIYSPMESSAASPVRRRVW